MWDLTVLGNNDHDFYVVAGATAVLVHNCGTIDFAHGSSLENAQSIMDNGVGRDAAGPCGVAAAKPGTLSG
jgi:hypothetical protein